MGRVPVDNMRVQTDTAAAFASLRIYAICDRSVSLLVLVLALGLVPVGINLVCLLFFLLVTVIELVFSVLLAQVCPHVFKSLKMLDDGRYFASRP